MNTAPRTLELGRVGESVKRVDAVPKVTGEFAYSSDLFAAGMLWGHTVRSPHAHARVLAIDVSEALISPGVHAVLTHEDVPGEKLFGLEHTDQPVLARRALRRLGQQPDLLVVADRARGRADEARDVADAQGGARLLGRVLSLRRCCRVSALVR